MLDTSAQGDLVAQSSEQAFVLQIPSGNLGFTLLRTEPVENPDVATDELENLYKLLHYAIPTNLANFQSRLENLPIGPVETKDETEWLYEKVLPVYAFANARSNSAALREVLSNTLNPYYGIGDIFSLDFCWQDVYGNRLGDRTKGQLSQKLGHWLIPSLASTSGPLLAKATALVPVLTALIR